MKIICHIGIHKTGTTAIQQFLSRNRDLLVARRVLYPSSFLKFNAHHPLPWALGVRHPERTRDNDPEDIARSIIAEAEMRNVECVILSSEEFRNLEPSAIKKLKELFGEAEIEVVVYLRRQDEFLISKYGQHVRMYSIRYSGTIYDFYLRHNFINRYNYWELITRWANIFGERALNVRVYERSLFPEGNVVLDFFKAIGLDASGLSPTNHNEVNKNLSPLGLEILRRLNGLSLDQNSHHAALRLLDDMRFDDYPSFELLSQRNRADLMAQFKYSNTLVAKKWLKKQNGMLFKEHDIIDEARPSATLNSEIVIASLLECLAMSLGRHSSEA